jgi:hypothetical protein
MSQQRQSAWLPGPVGRREFLAGAAAAAVAPRLASGHADGPAVRRPEVAAIYCPLWHRYDHMDAWHGPGWTEWELLKTAPPRFPGHRQPLVPSWGHFDESDPQWTAREIDLAADHGIDVFLFDWYWYSGVRLMEETLERGFLGAANNRRLKFALMWANHDWADYFPAPYDKPWNSWLPQRHSADDLARVVEYGIEHYFRQPNYWTVDGRLFFSIFAPKKLIAGLGGPAGCRAVLANLDQRLARAKLPPVHWNAMTLEARAAGELEEAGFASTTTYHIKNTGKTSAALTQDYEDLIQTHANIWQGMAGSALPYCPVVTMGWDVTPRCEHDVPWPFAKPKYPYEHVVLGNTPERFGRLCQQAADHAADERHRAFAVFINAWNEWTEGSYLLPEEHTGTAYLEALKVAFGR